MMYKRTNYTYYMPVVALPLTVFMIIYSHIQYAGFLGTQEAAFHLFPLPVPL